MTYPIQPLQVLFQRRLGIFEHWPSFLTPHNISKQHPDCQENHLDTKYGLRLRFSGEKIIVSRVIPTPPISKARYVYALHPVFETSYLWYPPLLPSLPSSSNIPINEKEISTRYPALFPYYISWKNTYETALKEQKCFLGPLGVVFSDAYERAAWELEGCLIACWLALGDDVESVEYTPRREGMVYMVRGDGDEISEVLMSCLREVEKESGDVLCG